MKLEIALSQIIKAESEKIINRFQLYQNQMHFEHIRNKKRLGLKAPAKVINKPDYWKIDNKFNPFYVKRKHKSIAKSICRKIQKGQYIPNKPYIKNVPKKDGGIRKVAIYQIQDAAVSKLYYSKLLSKNKHRFSSFSYAYRNDRNVHFAIQDISIELQSNDRIYTAEFDFSDFFGSISHEYLFKQFDKNGFLISNEDIAIIKAFLQSQKSNRGIPQGTSISLFLANLVCWELDKELEKLGVKFSRYADDTIIWASNYNQIGEAFQAMSKFSKLTGVKINPKKSEGINLLSREGLQTEIRSKKSLNFLGYTISIESTSINERSVKKIKKQISYLLYRNLIQPLKQTNIKGHTIPSNNRDYHFLVAMQQVRRYMYGSLDNRKLTEYIAGRTKRIYFKGIMSFYPLVNDIKQLASLDGWLVSTVYRAVQKRNKLLKNRGFNKQNQFPFNCSKKSLMKKSSIIIINKKKLLEYPSFCLIQKAMQKGIIESGIEKVMNPESLSYDY